jgi:AcrR family transcriptional regulator
MRKAPEPIRVAIRRAALDAFCVGGYRGTTLQEIAEQVGLSRGAVLHHFRSKADLLNAVLEPYGSALDRLLDTADMSDPPTLNEQQRLLGDLAGLVLRHRQAVELLMRDIAASHQLDSAPAWAARTRRLTSLLAGADADDIGRIRTTASIGAILHPVATTGLALDNPDARAALAQAGLAAIGRNPGYVASTSGGS